MKHLYMLALLMVSTWTFSQQKISGKITNEAGMPLQFVTLHLIENNGYTETDENGNYQLKSVPQGNITIVVYLFGYEQQTLKINSLDVQEYDLTLKEKEQHLDEVIVSTAFNKIQSQNVMKVSHESMEEIKKSGAISLMDGVTNIPGVSQISTGTSIGKPVIRGLSSNRVLTYAQGVRLENQQFGEEHGLGLSASGIESVEVIKGPASLLYGSDAIGGVLYFNPEKYAPNNTTRGNVFQQFASNTQGTNTSFGIKSSPNNWKFLLRANYNSQADYKISSGDRITNTRSIEKDLKYGIGYANSRFSTDIRYNYNQLNLGLPEEGIENTGFRNPLYPKQDIDNHILSLNQKVYFKNSKLEADLGYTFNNRKELEDVDVIALHMKLKTGNYNIKYYLPKWKNLETIVGVQGMHQTNSNFGEEMLIPDATVDDFGTFITSNYEWNTNVLQAGIRFDNRNVITSEHGTIGEEGYFGAIDKKFNSFNFALGYKTNLTDKIISRINLASGFRAPNLSELTSNGVHEGSNRYEIGNQNLKNEQNFQADLNLEYKSEHFEYFINGFYNHINNYIFISPTGNMLDANYVYEYLQNNATLYGGETGIHLHPHPIDWLHFTSSYEMVIGKQKGGEYLPLIPANQWKNTLRGEFELGKWFQKAFANLQVNYTFDQNNISSFETKTNDYTLVNLGLGGTVKLQKMKFDLSLNAKNLLDKTYVAHLSRLKSDGIPNMGRNIVLGINFNF
ncbi:TonB-dependent receptor [Flavobacterium sp. NRK F10]|uniref:TonB-dependent receptor n=1 Tax=Flavobacterium sp. NRK F10 TaxID=2954931 RepID=UPI0020909499|nr:TonB-dependent receptor [Flavobacterium sp. NRK F10]MCO6174548.1 TonB-dependent receptor [Flavobacterium sp. NRK F10]